MLDGVKHMVVEQVDSTLQSIESFTGREQDVMQAMAQFQTNEEIADDLSISIKTVRWYIKQIYSKLGVNNRVKAIEVIQALYDTGNEETTRVIATVSEPQVAKSIPKENKKDGVRQELLITILMAFVLLILVGALKFRRVPHVMAEVSTEAVVDEDSPIQFISNCRIENSSPESYGLCINIEGGIPRLINSDLNYPWIKGLAWHPDGEQLVFAGKLNHRETRLITVNIDGSNPEILLANYDARAQEEPAWSPDGQWIAFHDSGPIAIVRPDGTGLERVWSSNRHGICSEQPQWSPDSQYLVFSVGNCSWGQTSERDIVMLSLIDGSSRTIAITYHDLGECRIFIENVAFNPDGSHIAYTDGACNHILQDIETGETTRLAEFPIAWTAAAYPQWSGETPPIIVESIVDSQVADDINSESVLLATFCDGMSGHSDEIFGLCILPLNGDAPELVLSDFPYPSGGSIAWSPQGDQLIFSAHKYDDRESPTLFIAYPEVDDWREFLPEYDNIGQANPSWSPDGQWIAFQMDNGIVIIHPDGTGLQTIWQSPDDDIVPDQPQWSPDSRQIIFSSGTNGWIAPTERDIILVLLDDLSATILTTTNHSSERCRVILENLAFSPDGTQIAYTDGDCNHILQDIETGEATILAEFPLAWTSAVYPQWGSDD